MSYITSELLNKGYLLFPKALFEEQMKMKLTNKAESFFEAFVLVLNHVNYSEVPCCVRGYKFDCKRGESILPMSRWMLVFGWSRNRTRYFFDKMFDLGLVERLSNPRVTHIRVPDYDLLTGRTRPKLLSTAKDRPGEDFETFWKKYHEVTEKPKVNIGRARREWRKLSPEEKRLAVQNIDEYYDHLSNIKYCRQAASYLADKSFNDEYND